VDFAFSPEQLALRAAARDWLADRYPAERVAELAESATGHDPGAWAQLRQLGWVDPDLGVLDTALLFEESGAALLPAPLFSSVALGVPGTGGERPSTLAWAEPGEQRLGGPVATVADPDARLTGHKILVPDLAAAEVLLVVATDGIYAVDPADAVVVARSTLDRTRRLSEVRLDATPGRRVAPAETVAAIRLRAGVAVACEAVGVAQRMLDLSARHVSTREQFGRVIGTYQAVSHQVANMYVAVELARSLAYWAAWSVQNADAQAELAVAAATWSATEAAVRCCESAIQVHGGLGFTYDAPLHRYYKRAQWLSGFTGDGAPQREAISSALLARAGR
jgi:alkylation response protein AidB-like acyl-CoA dehydrogenase